MSLELTPAEDEILSRVRELWESADKTHAGFRPMFDRMFRLWSGYQNLEASLRGEPDRDEVIHEAKKEWGATLALPIAFAIVETITPRALSHRPRMLILPRERDAEKNVENMRFLIDAQQERIDYELRLQTTAKTAFMYGIGVQKTGWRSEYRKAKRLRRRILGRGYVSEEYDKCVFDDPWAEDIDPMDFRWDGFADHLENAEYVFHRAWRPMSYVMKRIEEGDWRHLEEDDVRAMSSPGAYQDAWKERMVALGHTDFNPRGDRLHEVWEFHNREQVITILDRQVPVLVRENPAWHGDLPFQVYRPTEVPHQLVGKGEIEPLENLIREMNTLRSQRLDNATVSLMRSYAYDVNILDANDLKFGPGTGIPVNGRPDEALWPLPVHDIPNSSYQEVEALMGDIDRASGLSDAVIGGEGGTTQTATGMQLLTAAANERIKLKTHRFEAELITPQCRQFVAMNQQNILEPRQVRGAVQPVDSEQGADPEKRWTWRKLGPEELAGEMTGVCAGGSSAPENVPEKMQRGQAVATFCQGNTAIDPRKWVPYVLEQFGIRDAEGWLTTGQMVPATVLEVLVKMGVPEEAIAQALDQVTAQEQGGPPPQVNEPPPDAAGGPTLG